MSVLYRLHTGDENSEDTILVSKDYVDSQIKALQDALITHEKNCDSAHSVSSDNLTLAPTLDNNTIEDIYIVPSLPEISGENINQDPNHRLMSDSLINILKNKPSTFELEQAVNDVENRIKAKLNEQYTMLLNTRNAVPKLREIANLLDGDKDLEEYLHALSDKISLEDLENHIGSNLHLNNNDRKALNLMLAFIKEGAADWEADETKPNHIRNKPESLPANGGNADTVGGLSIDQLGNKKLEVLTVGESHVSKPEDVDYLYDYSQFRDLKTGDYDLDLELVFNNERVVANKGGIIGFKRGLYTSSHVDFIGSIDKRCIIRGSGVYTTVFDFKFLHCSQIQIEDLGIEDCTQLIVSTNSIFKNVTFTNCNIVLNNSENCTFLNCEFKSCNFVMNGFCFNNIVSLNRFNNSKVPKYIGGNNIIVNNIEI